MEKFVGCGRLQRWGAHSWIYELNCQPVLNSLVSNGRPKRMKYRVANNLMFMEALVMVDMLYLTSNIPYVTFVPCFVKALLAVQQHHFIGRRFKIGKYDVLRSHAMDDGTRMCEGLLWLDSCVMMALQFANANILAVMACLWHKPLWWVVNSAVSCFLNEEMRGYR